MSNHDNTLNTTLFNILPYDIWQNTISQAKRSTLMNFRTGAILFSEKTDKIVGKGCSHISENTNYSSVHAEQHALIDGIAKKAFQETEEISIVIITINKNGNFTYSSRPCLKCANLLANNHISTIYYPERLNNGEWIVNVETPINLLARFAMSNLLEETTYAKSMSLGKEQ